MDKQRWKNILVSLCVVIALILGIFSVMNSKEKPDTIRIAMIPKITGISYFDKCYEGAKEVASIYGMEVIYKGPTTADAAVQVNIIQDMIYNDVDIIAIAPIDPNAVKPMLDEARKKGIIVVTFDADATEESRDMFVNQVSAQELGEHIIENLVNLIGEEGKYAIVTASMTADNQNTWIRYMKSYMETKYPKLQLITTIPTDEDQQKAYANTRNLLQAYPEIKAIVAMSTEAGPGAAQAFRDLDINGEVKLYTLALPNDMRTYIKEGQVQLTTLWNPYDLGKLTVEIAHKLLEGETIEDGAVFDEVGPITYLEKEKIVIMDKPLDFNQENIDDFDF